ncbi:MAG: M48 family metalloprotease, partial [Firmicutes bacterium]|nr:M48 family metalloprotease [Bacillota bacterium]
MESGPRLAALIRRAQLAQRNAWLSFALLSGFVVAIGASVGYIGQATALGAYVALAVLAVCAGYALLVAPRQVARKVRACKGRFGEQDIRVRGLLEPLSARAGVGVPAVLIIPSQAGNAFAAGLLPSQRCVGITTGALERLDDRQLGAVLAHEVAHLARKDTLFIGWWVALLGVVVSLSVIGFAGGLGLVVAGRRRHSARGRSGIALIGWILMGCALIGGSFAFVAIQLWLRADMRRRERRADDHAVALTGSAVQLADALEILGRGPALLARQSALAAFFAMRPSSCTHWWMRLFDT